MVWEKTQTEREGYPEPIQSQRGKDRGSRGDRRPGGLGHGSGRKDASWREVPAFAASILGTFPCRSLSATTEQTKPEVPLQTLHAAGKQGPSVPFNALSSLILHLCSPSEERTHSGSFITALITAAGIKAPGCGGTGLCSCRKPIPFYK